MTMPSQWLTPSWPAPASVRAFVTTREGGASTGEYASMNLAMRSGDDPRVVARNREILRSHLPGAPRWMAQVHGVEVADLDTIPEDVVPTADAAATSVPGRVAAVLTADCLPLFLCDRAGRRVAVAHAGWRGMAAGVIENTVRAIGVDPAEVLAWMGPAIGPAAFEVGAEVRDAFARFDPAAVGAFSPRARGKYLGDLYALARQRLAGAGVSAVHGGGFCTRDEPDRFFSYRREPRSGRMGSFIWIMPVPA